VIRPSCSSERSCLNCRKTCSSSICARREISCRTHAAGPASSGIQGPYCVEYRKGHFVAVPNLVNAMFDLRWGD
jgi:hypothetical protein